MKYAVLIMSIFIVGFTSCNNDDDDNSSDCIDTTITTTSLESEYGCINTEYQMDIALTDTFMIIRNQADFDELTAGSCEPTIDFVMYDLVIGKQGLTNGFSSIEYVLIEDCNTENQNLFVTFILDETDIAPNVTYHGLIPKLDAGQELSVEIAMSFE